jgi:hypothetical protein
MIPEELAAYSPAEASKRTKTLSDRKVNSGIMHMINPF